MTIRTTAADPRQMLRDDPRFFLFKMLKELGAERAAEPYREYLLYEAEKFVQGRDPRSIVNLPPNHGKTTTYTLYVTTRLLGFFPTTKLLLLCHNAKLAELLARNIRKIIDTDWFRAAFPNFRGLVWRQNEFELASGGSLRASHMGAALAGFRADSVIIDDPHDMDAKRVELARAVEFYNEQVISRLNDPMHGRIAVIGHRIGPHDLSGHLAADPNFRRIVLPFEATECAIYQTFDGLYKREKGELLRPTAYGAKEVQQCKDLPSYPWLYQQGVDSAQNIFIQTEHFPYLKIAPAYSPPIIFSIDANSKGAEGNSYSVIVVASPLGNGEHLLRYVYRARVDYNELKRVISRLAQRYSPSLLLVEDTAIGSVLLRDHAFRQRYRVEPVYPIDSKNARLLRHAGTITAGKVKLHSYEQWTEEFLEEMTTDEPEFTDQRDALLQYLDAIPDYPLLAPPSRNNICTAAPFYGYSGPSNLMTHVGVTSSRGFRRGPTG
jgi:hypothetical protein